jgi:hypothetical protein
MLASFCPLLSAKEACYDCVPNRQANLYLLSRAKAVVLQKVLDSIKIRPIFDGNWEQPATSTLVSFRPSPAAKAASHNFVMNNQANLYLLSRVGAIVLWKVLNKLLIWDINACKWECSITRTPLCLCPLLSVKAACYDFVVDSFSESILVIIHS